MIDEATARKLLDRVMRIPIVDTLELRMEEWGDGFCKATIPYDKRWGGVYESRHGGILMTLADSIACFAIMTRTGPDQIMTTTDMNIRFLAPCLTDLTAMARIIKLGKTLCPVQVGLFDADMKKVALATISYMLLDKMPTRT